MKVVTQSVPVIKFSPRFYPDLLDTLVLILDKGVTIPFTWTILKNNIISTLGNTAEFTQGEAYSFTITRGQDIVYKGKIIFVADNTDIQNYSNKSQNTKRWE